MKISGFSFIRNAMLYDYPIVEAITSILPICDEFVVAVGNSTDDTMNLIRNINSPKIRIIQTVWDDTLKEGGRVLADETNKAFAQIAPDSDWAFYIQGDEVVHEDYLPMIRENMQKYLTEREVEGLLFKYLHFYGNYQYVGASRQWYRNEIRIIRNDKSIYSYKDAQGFRKNNNKKLRVKQIEAYIFHYGWVKNPVVQQRKIEESLGIVKQEADNPASRGIEATAFDYATIDSLALFEGTHPQVIQARIKKINWEFKFDIRKKHYKLKHKISHWIENLTGWRIGEYKNYILMR
jgi:hypothetical protein